MSKVRMNRKYFFDELCDIRLKLIDFLMHIKMGELTYLKEISTKLRILYCDSKDTRPLIKIISDEYNFDILVNCPKNESSIPKSLKQFLESLGYETDNNMIKELIGDVIWFKFDREEDLKDIFEAIEKELWLFDRIDKGYSYRNVIKAMADSMGGCHIDEKVKEENLFLFNSDIYLINELPAAKIAMMDIVRNSIQLIDFITEYINSGKENPFIRSREIYVPRIESSDKKIPM